MNIKTQNKQAVNKSSYKNHYVSVYLRNSEESPSCYYRVFQYLKEIDDIHYKINNAISLKQFRRNLRIENKVLKFFYQSYLFVIINFHRILSILGDLIHKPYCVIIQREVYPKFMPLISYILLRKLLKSTFVIWDFDDNIIFNKEISNREKSLLEENSNTIIVISEFLKSTLSEMAQKKVHYLPTTDGFANNVDLAKILQKRLYSFTESLKVVWVGTSSNLHFLELIADEIDMAGAILLNKFQKKLELFVVCNKPFLNTYTNFRTVNIPWSRSVAEDSILSAHIGIMPLVNNNYTKGKGGFKLVQYISTGLPVIASNVGYNVNIVTSSVGYLIDEIEKNKWEAALVEIGANQDKWLHFSNESYIQYSNNFSFYNNLQTWIGLLQFHT